MTRVVVVGGGVAGVAAALASSRSGAPTTLIESSTRVGVSKALMPFVLSDGWTEADLLLPEAGSLADQGIEVRTGESVASVSHRERMVEVEPSASRGLGRGRSVPYDSLVICTGAAGQAPSLRGSSKPNVFVLAGPSDYLRLGGALGALGSVVVSGPIPLALKLGEILAARTEEVRVYCGSDGLERQFSTPVAEEIRRRASACQTGRVIIVDGAVESILGVERAEAVVSEGAVRTCDAVVLVPKSVPSFPRVDCEKGRNGGLLVDASMSTSVRGVFAAGDSAEMRFKAGSVPARLHSASAVGGGVAGTNAAGGDAKAALSWTVEQTYFGLEYCSAGLTLEDAAGLGLDAASEVAVSKDSRSGRRKMETLVSMVYDAGTHQVYGLQAAGWRALSLSGAASLIVSLGLTAEQLLSVEFAYSPGIGQETSPIALTAGKIVGPKAA